MALAPGTRIGTYEIAALIGEGGMGEVYRATDTNLKRQVAIKVLPKALASDVERLARFQREAEVLASLNHPNIATIHGLEKSDGVTALVMELVEGPTLAERLVSAQGSGIGDRGPGLPVDEALAIAKQIAEALEAAHEHGIVHRDLKPANVKIRPDGAVKVLDFGLAKAMDPVGSGQFAVDSESPTITTPAQTLQGVILGTAAYMSPEQAQGKPVDRRADVWAFGVVLFEMLTGRRPFVGESVPGVIAAVIATEPDWELLARDVPRSVRACLRRCLQKDPRQRIRDVGDAQMLLAGAFDAGATAEPDLATTRAHPRHMWVGLAAGLVIGALGLALILWTGNFGGDRIQTTQTLRRFPLVIPPSRTLRAASGGLVALSPDGHTVVYRALEQDQWRLYRWPLDRIEAVPIPGTEGAGPEPFFSWDGQWLGFWSGTTLMKVALDGGRPVEVAEITAGTRGASWGADDNIVIAARSAGLLRVPGGGGTADTLLAADDGREYWYPQALPERRAVIFTSSPVAFQRDVADVRVLDLDTGMVRTVVERASSGWYLPTGHLVFERRGDLWAAAFDLARLELRGDPVPVEQGIRVEVGGAPQFAWAADGSLVYLQGGQDPVTLVWSTLDGREERLPLEPGPYSEARISPDGQRLVFARRDAERGLWTYELPAGPPTRLTFGEGEVFGGPWTPDGEHIAYSQNGDLHLVPANGGVPEQLTHSLDWDGPGSFTPDGRTLVFRRGQLGSQDLWTLDLSTREAKPLVATAASEAEPRLSQDGRWLAYQSDATGQNEIYVGHFPTGPFRRVSSGGGLWPMWAGDGRTLFFMENRRLIAVSIGPGATLVTGAPVTVTEDLEASPLRPGLDVDHAGQRILLTRPVSDTTRGSELVVVQNWFTALRRIVPQ